MEIYITGMYYVISQMLEQIPYFPTGIKNLEHKYKINVTEGIQV